MMKSFGHICCCATFFLILSSNPLIYAKHTDNNNFLKNGGFESGKNYWQCWGKNNKYDVVKGIAKFGGRSFWISNNTPTVGQAFQEVTFDKPVMAPLKISAWSKAKNVIGSDYCIYVDIIYKDGTKLYAQRADFAGGTHDWQYSEKIIYPAKPVAKALIYAMLRGATGTVWFDRINFSYAPLKFKYIRIIPSPYSGNGLAILSELSHDNTNVSLIISHKNKPLITASAGNRYFFREWSDLSKFVNPTDKLSITLIGSEKGGLYRKIQKKFTISLPKPSKNIHPLVWTASPMKRIFPDDFPPENATRNIHISLARNEYEAAQIAIRTPHKITLKNVKLTMTDLIGKHGNTITKENLKWYLVCFVYVRKTKEHPFMQTRQYCWWPDPLIPVSSFDIAPSFTQPIWITAYAPTKTLPGKYHGKIKILTNDKLIATIPITINVLDFTIPHKLTFKTAFSLYDGFLEKVYGKPVPDKIRYKYAKMLLQHRLNYDDINRDTLPRIKDLLKYREMGMNCFNILDIKPHHKSQGWTQYGNKNEYTKSFENELIKRLDPYMKKLKKTGLIKMAYFYGFDERGKDYYPIMKRFFGLLKSRYPGVHTMTTNSICSELSPKLMRELNVDWACPATWRYNLQRSAIRECQKQGFEVWTYTCAGTKYPYAAWFLDDPLIEARAIWWQVFLERVNGFLFWLINKWSASPLNLDNLPFCKIDVNSPRRLVNGKLHDWLYPGDGILIYPLSDGPASSIRLENIRDGLEDYEYLHAIKAKFGEQLANQLCSQVARSLTYNTYNPNTLQKTRESMISILTKSK